MREGAATTSRSSTSPASEALASGTTTPSNPRFLAVNATVEFNVDVGADGKLRNGRKLRDATIVRLSEDGKGWREVKVQARSSRYISAVIDRLGIYALAESTGY